MKFLVNSPEFSGDIFSAEISGNFSDEISGDFFISPGNSPEKFLVELPEISPEKSPDNSPEFSPEISPEFWLFLVIFLVISPEIW